MTIKDESSFAKVKNFIINEKIPARVYSEASGKWGLYIKNSAGEEIKVADILSKDYIKYAEELGIDTSRGKTGSLMEAAKNTLRAIQSGETKDVIRSKTLLWGEINKLYTKKLNRKEIRILNEAIDLLQQEPVGS